MVLVTKQSGLRASHISKHFAKQQHGATSRTEPLAAAARPTHCAWLV